MLALKEFANFIFLNLANLTTTYDRLLAENDEAYKTLPVDTRIVSARKLIKAVAEACEAGTPDPFRQHFANSHKHVHLLGGHKPPQSLLEIECLGQTLTPVVTNLEAGKFLWQTLADVRALVIKEMESPFSLSSPASDLTSQEKAGLYPQEQSIQAVKEEMTRRKQMETTLDQERQFLRALIDSFPDYIYAKDTESRFTLANMATAQSIGDFTPEELIGKTDFDFHPKELAAQYYADEQQLIRSGQPLLNKEEFMIDPSGNQRWLSTSKVPLRDSHGNISGFVGINRDITKRKQLEQQIQESLERRARQVQTSTEIAQHISTVATLDDLFRQVANRVQAQFGYYHVQVYTLTEDGLVLQEGTGEAGRHMKESGHKIPLTDEENLVVRALWSGEPVLAPDVSRQPAWLPNPLLPETKAELVVPINLGAEILGMLDVQSDRVGGLDEEDELVLVGLCGQIAVAIDSRRVEADRRRMEERLAEERNLLRALVDNLPDQIYIKDAESRFLLVNPAVARNLKVATPDEVVGKTDFDFLPAELAEQYYDNERALLQSGQSELDYEESGFDPEMGMTKWFLSTKIPFRDSQGRIAGLVGLNRDITPIKQTQEILAKTLDEAETLYQANADMNIAQTYEDILQVLRRYTFMGQGAQNVSLNHFDRPWTDNQTPIWISTLARYSELPQESVRPRYPVSAFPSIHQLLRADAPTLIENVQTDPRLDNNARMLYGQQFGAKSTIFVPLVVGRQWIGYANAIYQQLTTFPEPEVRRLMLLAGNAAVAMQSILRLTESERSERRERLLHEASTTMTKTVDPETIIKVGLETLGRELNQPGIIIQLTPETGSQVFIQQSWNTATSSLQPTFVYDGSGVHIQSASPSVEGNFVTIPIRLRNASIGQLRLPSNSGEGWAEGDIAFAEATVREILVALENSSLVQAIQRQARREQTIREITEKMRAATSLQDLVKTTAYELGQRLSTGHAMVELGIEADRTTDDHDHQ